MISQLRRASFGRTAENVKTIEFSMIEQSVVNGDTPPTFEGRPTCVGVPPNTASMCGTLPGSVVTTWTSKREKISVKHETVSFHTVPPGFHAGIETCWLTMVEKLLRESLLPGRSVTPVWFR